MVGVIIEKLDKNNNGIKLKDITKYLNPFFMVFDFSEISHNLSHETIYFNNLTIILKLLTCLRENHILLFDENKNIFSINKKHCAYKSYYTKYNMFLSSFGELFNISLLNNLQDDNLEIKINKKSNNLVEDNESDENNEQSSTISDNKTLLSKSDVYYCYDSNTCDKTYHFIDSDKNICSCKGFLYRQKCSHMNNLIEKNKYDHLITYSEKDDKYYCNSCKTDKSCIHLDSAFVHITQK